MDSELTEEQAMIRTTVRDFAQKEVAPVARDNNRYERFPTDLVKKMGEMGFLGLSLPAEHGGDEADYVSYCIMLEELGRADYGTAVTVSVHLSLGAKTILRWGNAAQKQKYLPGIASGKWTTCLALSEPEAGSDAGNIKTTAAREGKHFIINGLKHFITNGDIADLVTLIAVTDKEKRARGGITAFIVEKGTPGFSVGNIERTMGLRGSHTCELVFDSCRIPVDNVIGGEAMIGRGFKTAMKVLDKGRLTLGACALGAAQKLLDLCISYSKERVQFGKPIARFQSVGNMLADMATEVYAARQMLYNAAWLKDNGRKVTKEASMVKLFCTEMACRVADNAVQIFGAMGYVKDFPVERFYRDLRLYRIYEGTSEIQRNIIAREVTK